MHKKVQVVDSKAPNTPCYEWGTGCLAWVLSTGAACTIKEELMAPGTREQLHLHKAATQFFYILEGSAEMYLDGERFFLTTNQGLEIPPMTTHYIANNAENQLRFLVITAPGEAQVDSRAGSSDSNIDRENLPE